MKPFFCCVLALLVTYDQLAQAAFLHTRNESRNSQPFTLIAQPPKYESAPKAPPPTCSEPHVANEYSDLNDRCPEECPFFVKAGRWGGAQQETRFCTFKCVQGDKCAEMDKRRPVQDKELGICRGPQPGLRCKRANLDGTDTCELCDDWFVLKPDGQCRAGLELTIIRVGGLTFVGIILLCLVYYIVELVCRPICNEEALEAGLKHREMVKVKKQILKPGKTEKTATPSDFISGSKVVRHASSSYFDSHDTESLSQRVEDQNYYPLTTNLCTSGEVAGPGLTLHFTFQAGIMLWALFVVLVWIVLALCINTGLFTIGQDTIGTHRQNCIVVAQGYHLQLASQWISILYLSIVYGASFLGALVYSVVQLRKFQSLDNEYKSMVDFAALLVGLPPIPGDESVESKLEEQLNNHLGLNVVGVSIAWNYKHQADEVEEALQSLTASTAPQMGAHHSNSLSPSPRNARDILRNGFRKFEKFAFSSAKKPADVKAEDVKEMLSNLKTSKCAFVVFNTEADRDQACEKMKGGMQFEGSKLVLEDIDCAPETISWVNFDGVSQLMRAARLLKGVGEILVGLVVWTVFFFAPYAWTVYTFNYDNGLEPGITYGLAFMVVVIAGNQIMYFLCDRVADHMGFHFEDQKQAAYMILYTFACMMNVILDFVVTYHITYKIVEGLNFWTHNGVHMSRVRVFPEALDTYAMQLKLAQNVFDYAMPSTFLLPFLLEPFMINVIPLTLRKLLVRSNKALTNKDAKGALEPPPMELGRYGDILLNVFIFTLILGFPGSWAWQLALCLVISHVFIYMWDHYRVLRVMKNFTVASMCVDWWSQIMLAPMIGTIAFMLTYKCLWQGYANQDGVLQSSWGVAYACTGAFFAHIIVHILLIVFVVPLFGKKHIDLHPEITYQDLEERVACSWFNSNPVQCLRHEFRHSRAEPVKFKKANAGA